MYQKKFKKSIFDDIIIRHKRYRMDHKFEPLLHLVSLRKRDCWCPDPVHLGKNLRKRFLKYRTSLSGNAALEFDAKFAGYAKLFSSDPVTLDDRPQNS